MAHCKDKSPIVEILFQATWKFQYFLCQRDIFDALRVARVYSKAHMRRRYQKDKEIAESHARLDRRAPEWRKREKAEKREGLTHPHARARVRGPLD